MIYSIWTQLILVFAIGLLLQGCDKGNNIKSKKALIDQRADCPSEKPPFYNLDSSLIIWATKTYIDKKVRWYNGLYQGNAGHKEGINVDTLYYDASYLKMLAVVSVMEPIDSVAKYIYDQKEIDYYYSDCEYLNNVYTIIAYRNKINDLWKAWPIELWGVRGSCNGEMKGEDVKYFLENELRDVSLSRHKYDSLGHYFDGSRPVGFNINDCEFWKESTIWEKGYRLEGFYLFETGQNAGPQRYPNSIRKYVELEIPDTLRLKYNIN